MRFHFLMLLFVGVVAPMVLSGQITFADCTDKQLCFQNDCATLTTTLSTSATTNCGPGGLSFTYRLDIGNNGSNDLQGSGNSVTPGLPAGVSKITWRATDLCGNIATCTQLITVQDCTAPTMLCSSGINQSLGNSCVIQVTPQQFVVQITDNCTPPSQMQYRIRRVGQGTGFPDSTFLTFSSCDAGTNLIEVWARDANGLTTSCNNYVLVQNNTNTCDCIDESRISVQGCARSSGNLRLNSYRIQTIIENIPGTPTAPTVTIRSRTTNYLDSCYNMLIEDLPIDTNVRVRVRARRFDFATTGFTTYDLVLISRHILGLEPFTSFYQMMSADMNNSQTVTSFDIIEGRKVLLGIYDTFPAVPSWRFIKPMANTSNLVAWADVEDTYQFNFVGLYGDSTRTGVNFIGVKTGDLNRNAQLTGEPDEREAPILRWAVDDALLAVGKTVEVAIRAQSAEDLAAWQMALHLDPALVRLESIEGLPDDAWYLHPDGTLRVAWLDQSSALSRPVAPDEVVFVLKINALQNTTLSQALRLVTETLPAEATLASTQRRRIELDWRGQSAVAPSIRLRAPQPNPFAEQTTFGLWLPESTTATLEIFDVTGRRVYHLTRPLEAGAQVIEVPAAHLPATGVLLYRLRAADAMLSGRVVRF
jgi:hypothetical protein